MRQPDRRDRGEKSGKGAGGVAAADIRPARDFYRSFGCTRATAEIVVSRLSDAADPDIANRRGCRCLGPATQNRQRSRCSREFSIEHVQAPRFALWGHTRPS